MAIKSFYCQQWRSPARRSPPREDRCRQIFQLFVVFRLISKSKIDKFFALEDGVGLLFAAAAFYANDCQPEIYLRVNNIESKSFREGVGLRLVCVLSPLLFMIDMNWMDKLSRTDECVTIGRCKFSRVLFTDNLVLLATYESSSNLH